MSVIEIQFETKILKEKTFTHKKRVLNVLYDKFRSNPVFAFKK